MKKTIFTFLSMISFCFAINAAVITVSNNTASPGQYSNLQTAIDNSSASDTIYVQGSPTSYGNITINKKLTILGSGYAPDSTDFNLATIIGQITLDTVFTSPIKGIKIVGIYTTNYITYASGDRGLINDVTFERCYLGGYKYISGNNWVFLNCMFESGFDFGYYDNVMISNSFFFSSTLNYSDKNTISILNSIFLNYSGSYQFYTVSNMTVNNCIFWNNSVSGCSNCTFNNNITWDDVTQTLPYAGNSGTGNINNVDPKFVSTLPLPTSTIPYTSVKSYNWHLQAASSGHNAGTDGTDIGLYGGSLPNVNLTGMNPQIPVIKNFIVKNPVAQKNGTLNITVKAQKVQ